MKDGKNDNITGINNQSRRKLKSVSARPSVAPSHRVVPMPMPTDQKLQTAVQQYVADEPANQIFPEIANKDTFGPSQPRHIADKEIRDYGHLPPRGND